MNIIPFSNSLSSVSISVMGYNYDLLTGLYLSSSSLLFPYITSFNSYTNLRKVSAFCPPFSGYPAPSYTVLDKNRIAITINNTMFLGNSGYIDIIFTNKAGYTKLSDKNFLVEYLSGSGIDYRIIAINNDDILTIDNSYLVYIR